MSSSWMMPLYLFSSTYMVGLIWFVQVVHYPLFAAVKDSSGAYYREHVARTGWVTVPPMLAQAACAVWFAVRPEPFDAALMRVLLIVIALAWLVTFTQSVPQHNRLAGGYDAKAVNRLVATNWLRTALWSGHAMLLTAAVTR